MRRVRIRGFTLVEVIVSLALVATLVGATVELTITAARTSAKRQIPIERAAAARGVLRLIEDAVAAFDTFANNDPPRLEVERGTLRLRTRAGAQGAVVRSIEFDRPRGVLIARDLQIGEDRALHAADERVLARDVRDFGAAFDERNRVLAVVLEVAGHPRWERRWVIP